MEPSSTSTTQQPLQADLLNELILIRDALQQLLALAAQQERHERAQSESLSDLARLLEGFTSGGASFRSSQISPMVALYAAILGPILGDRIDGTRPREGDYLDEMTKGAAVMAQQLLRLLDDYQRTHGPLDYLRSACPGLGSEPPAADG